MQKKELCGKIIIIIYCYDNMYLGLGYLIVLW